MDIGLLYHEVGHALSRCSIQIIDSVNVNDFDNKEECNVELGCKEDFWIRTRCAIYPLDLNDRLQGTGSVSQGNVFGNEYFANPIRRRPRGHGHRSRCRTAPKMEISGIIDKLKGFYDAKVCHDFYVLLRSCSKQV